MRSAARAVLNASTAYVVYTVAGYPAAAGALALLRPRPIAADRGEQPTVSLIIAAHDEEAVIEEKLADVARLHYPRERLEVVVAADGCSDATPRLAAAVDGVRVLFEPERRGKLAAVERAIAATSGSVIVLTDANNRLDTASLTELTAPFADPAVGVVTGRKSVDARDGRPLDRAERLYWRYESRLKAWESATGSVLGACGEILAFRREAYRTPGADAVTEDFASAVLAAADGWRVVYAPRAVSRERASATVEDEAVRRARLVTGRWQTTVRVLPRLLVRHPALAWRMLSHKAMRPGVPFALAGLAVSAPAAWGTSRLGRVVTVAQLGFYAAAALGWHDHRRGRRRWTFLPFYLCRMNLAALRGLADFAGGRDLRAWTRVTRG
jgi:cellulose synthase/poly-beta-1,6-N-acetylglucosamine synthase-like glycosyltransferase